MGTRKLKVDSIQVQDEGLGSRLLVSFNRNLTPLEVEGFRLLVTNLVNESNRK